MVKDKQNSGAQNRNIKKRKLINEAANDKTQTKLFFKPITQSSSILNNKNSLCNNIEDNVVIETIINNKVTHTVQEENDNLINSIENTSDKINHDVESMSSDSYLNCDGVSNKDNLMDLSAAEQYLEQSCNSESFNDDNIYNFETLADTAAFMAPSIEDSFKSKLKFLDQHPIQPIIFNHKKVVDIIIVLAKQNLAFRGHRYESITNLSNNQDNLNHGNFLALVKLIAKILGEQIQNSIVKEVTYSGQFSLEIDSTQDVSVVDQLTVCLRYVYKGEIKERLLKMIPIQFSTGEAQYTIVKSTLQSLGIDVKKIVGQSYDGAANMKGKFNGLQTHFKKDAPNSIFTHCHAHVLNLIIGDVTKCNIVSQNLFDLLQKTAVFFSESHKRTDVWKHILSINEKGSNKLRKLQKLGNTRWNSKDVALKTIFHSWSEDNNKRDRFFYLLISLHTLGYDEKYIKDTKMASEARALLMKWSSFENILETEGLDYIMAWNKIVNLMEEMKKFVLSFEEIKEKATEFSHNMSNRVKDIENIFIEDKLPTRRVKKIKKQSGELSDDSMSVFDQDKRFKIEVFQRISDVIYMAIKERFMNNNKLFCALAYLDPNRFVDINNGKLDFT
ncbi:zinc finger MYM-type protein 1-like, partial [Aphis craccivora]